MPFKVVQTLEGKKQKIFVVPSGWETDNILRYPNKEFKRYINDQNSIPLPEWHIMKCKVKRRNILSYEDGEKLIDEMLLHSDTEDDADNYRQKRRPQNKKETLNLNAMAENMIGNTVSTNDTVSSNDIVVADIHADSVPDITSAVQEGLCFDIEKIFDNQKQILENQATISKQIDDNRQQQLDNNSAIIAQIQGLISVQNGLIQKVSALSVQMEDAVSQIVSSCNADVLMLSDGKGRDENIPLHMKPVDNAQDLDNLEKQLSDSGFKDRLKNICSMLCSGGKGIDCAYMLVDVLFTRKFICECSWSGGSRGEELKVPLKGFKHVLSFFWSMVHQWDEKYTIKDNEMFFKTILKNAKKRKLAKCDRASTSRRSRSKGNMKRIKVSKNDATNASDKDINEEENAEENEENYDTLEENMDDHTEKSDIVEETMENNDKEYDTVQKNTVNNKVISDLAEEDTAENKRNIQKEIKKSDKLKMVDNKQNDAMQSTSKRIANQNMENNDKENDIVQKNTIDNKEISDLAEEDTAENKRNIQKEIKKSDKLKMVDNKQNDAMQSTSKRIANQNMENNDKENDTVQKYTINNKEISDLAEEDTAENKRNIQKEIKKSDKLKMVDNKQNDAMQSTSKRIANQNMENNDKENDTVQKYTINNKEISDLAEEDTAENKRNIQKEIKKSDKLKMVDNKQNDAMQSTSKRIANSDLIINKETSV